MGFLDRMIKNTVGNAIEEGVSRAIRPKVEQTAANVVNSMTDSVVPTPTAAETAQQAAASEAAAKNLSATLGGWSSALEGFANEAAKNLKVCPVCGEGASADKKFCPSCGAALPEQTMAAGAVCPNCGKQNSIGTSFCQECGTKLPSAVAAEQAAQAKDGSVMARWDTLLPQYTKWACGGNSFEFYTDDGYVMFSARFNTSFAAQNAVEQYRSLLKQNGFREAGQYPDKDHLYKMVGGVCYHVDTEHCFEGDSNQADVYFMQGEPTGGFNYVKPEPKKPTGFFDLFK